jgi:hypothetical protein
VLGHEVQWLGVDGDLAGEGGGLCGVHFAGGGVVFWADVRWQHH